MNPYLRIIRPLNCIMGSVAVLLVSLIAVGLNIVSYPISLILGMLTVFLITAGGNVINDYFDRESDLINHPDRPIPAGEIKPRKALVYSVALFAIGVMVAYPINLCSFIISILAIALLLLYENSLKNEGFVGNITISILVGMIFIFGGAIFGDMLLMVLLSFMAFFSNLGREIMKDVEDVTGDINRRTLPKRIGTRKAKIFAAAFVYVAVFLSPLPYIFFSFSIYYLIVVAIADAIFIYATLIQFKNEHLGQRWVKNGMLIGLVAYLIGGLT